MEGYSSFGIDFCSLRVSNDGPTKNSPPRCKYPEGIFNDTPSPAKSIVKDSLIF